MKTGPAVMTWSWVIIGVFSLFLVSSLAEICSAYPTMGALYYWSYRLGGDEWGPFCAWTAGWCNLLGQIAGVASGGFSGAEIISSILLLKAGINLDKGQFMALYAAVLVAAGVVNTFAETLLTFLCYFSEAWHVFGTILIVALMTSIDKDPKVPTVAVQRYYNGTTYTSPIYIALIGSLAAASTFTGYDTAAHCAEETTCSHNSSPFSMIMSVANCLVLGLLLIIGMNSCITDLDSLTNPDNTLDAATLLWQQTVGDDLTLLFQIIVFIGIECSNCANLTSCSRMVRTDTFFCYRPSVIYINTVFFLC
jgi:amino acid transporter